ncbi:MAG: hypothetical protein IJ316_01555 [Clostridia bacterium]|nr:hypothetical protein [Clostridia bacterium]
MKRCLSLILAFAVVLTMLVIPAYAAETPTATVTAKYATGVAPEAGEVFVVTIGLENVSTNSFKSGMVAWNWPAEVASLVDYMTIEDAEPYVLTNDDALAGYHVGNQLNPFAGRSGKFTIAPSSSTDITTGYSCAGLYIDNSARDKSIETLTDGTCALFDIAFVLNEGYTADDFYLTLSDTNSTKLILSDDDANESTVANGGLTLVGLEKKEEVIYYNSKHQPGVNSGDVDGVYELPQALTAGRTYEVSFTLQTSGTQGNNTLVALNNAAVMTANSYFGNSTIMMKFDGNTDINVRNGANTVKVGSLSAAATTVDVKYTVDLINNNWGVTVTENGAVTVEQSGLAFRNANLPIDALVLADNDSIENCLWVNADSIKIVDTTPDSVGEVVFKYVDAEGNLLEETPMSGETGATVEVAAKTITVNGVKYEAPAASGVVGTDAEVTVECAKVEVVTINYMLGEEVVGTKTVEGVDGSTVAYDAFAGYNTTAIYEAAAGEITVDADDLEVAVDVTVLYEGLVAANKQVDAAEFALPEAITTTGTVTFDLVVINAGDAGVLIGNGENFVSGTHFGAAVAQMNIGPEVLKFRNGANNEEVAVSTHGNTYHVVMTIDNTNGTWGAVVTDAEGNVVAEKADLAVRTTAETLDTISVLDNGSAGGTIVVQNLVVELGTTPEPVAQPVTVNYVCDGVTVDTETLTGAIGDVVTSTKVVDEEFEVDGVVYVVTEVKEATVSAEAQTLEVVVTVKETPAPEAQPVTVNYVCDGVTVDTETLTGAIGDETTIAAGTEIVVGEKTYTVDADVVVTVSAEAQTVEVAVTEKVVTPEPGPGEDDEPTPDVLPFEAVDVTVTTSAQGVTITGKFVDEDTTYETVVVVISYFKDGKAYCVQASTIPVINGEVEIPSSNITLTEGELTVAGISVLVGVDAVEAITTGNLGTPVGSYK